MGEGEVCDEFVVGRRNGSFYFIFFYGAAPNYTSFFFFTLSPPWIPDPVGYVPLAQISFDSISQMPSTASTVNLDHVRSHMRRHSTIFWRCFFEALFRAYLIM